MSEQQKVSPLTYFLGSVMVLMVALTLWQIFSRYVLNSPSTLTDELLRYLLIWSTMIGAMAAFFTGEHMALTLVAERMADRPKVLKTMKLTIHLLILVMFAVAILPGSIWLTMSAMGQLSPVLQVPMGYIYLILPVSAIIISLIELYHLKNLITKKEAN